MTELEFRTQRVTERVTRISGFNTELMYLVEGDDRAALLDTGSGFGSLRPCVDRLTRKPVVALMTHGHVDHALGAAEFEDCYISPLDEDAYIVHSGEAFRARWARMSSAYASLTPDQIQPVKPFADMKPLRPGDLFDLGGVSVEILACAGHTRGSLAMLVREERLLLLGDGCNYGTLLFDEHATSIAEYRESLAALRTATDGRYDAVLLSHGTGEGEPDMLSRVIDVCDNILAGRSDAQPMAFFGVRGLMAKATDENGRRLDGGAGNIAYNAGHIR